MRRIGLLFCMIWTLAIYSCNKEEYVPSSDKEGQTNNSGSNNETPGNDPGNKTDSIGGKTLIVVFSRAGENWQVGFVDRGNTAVMADYIKEFTDADMFEIEPVVPYPTDYHEMLQVSNAEFEQNARPQIKNKIENLASYSTIFIGSPIWHGNPPMIMRTLYESYPELASKTIVPFGTHGGSGISSCSRLIKEYFPDAKQLESLGISGSSIRENSSKEQVREWIERIGYKK